MMKQEKTIGIVGGGPAGSYLGYLLAKEGLKPVIFDDSHPREKPCGGGISPLAVKKFPILHDIPVPKAGDNVLKLISPKGCRLTSSSDAESWCLSRSIMDNYLLGRAVESGCKHVKEHVTSIRCNNSSWDVNTKENRYVFDIIVGADGVNGLVRKHVLAPIPNGDMGVCYGCFAMSDKEEKVVMKFFDDAMGYAWCFPRYDHLSIGVCSQFSDAKRLKKKLHDFLAEYYPHVRIQSFWGGKIPMIHDKNFFDLPCCGDDWILVGDATGHVEPLTGEGIVFALWGAELAAKAICNGDIHSYDTLWKKEFGIDLIESCKSIDLFYNTVVLENIIRFARRSKRFSTIINGIVCNELQQQHLFKELVANSPIIFKEFIFSVLTKQVQI
jgi:geranylgeranyl reductase family protein